MKITTSQLLVITIACSTAMVHGFAPRPLTTIASPRELVASSSRRFYEDAKDPIDNVMTKEEELQQQKDDTATSTIPQVDMERLTKLRPYPLFVAEKVASVLDGAVHSVSRAFGDGDDGDESTKTKERVVVLGSGWGATSFLSELDANLYDTTIISPRNHFIFTPMLASSSVGSVEYRSICEPIREINRKAKYLEATATDIDPQAQTVTCFPVTCGNDDGSDECDAAVDAFQVPYDRLVVTIGARTNTFGIPGVEEHCCFLKEIQDAKTIRTKLVNCFERAHMPMLTDEERRNLLTFCVIGAGPAGVEFAAELRDFVEQDGSKYYPELLKYVKIKVIEATNTVLGPFEQSLQEEALARMNRPVRIKDPNARNLLHADYKLQEVLLSSPVSEVGRDTIQLKDGREIKYGGLCVWAGGNGPVPLTQTLIDSLGDEQSNVQDAARGRIVIDRWMRALGGDGRILALGDCTFIPQDPLPATGQVASQQGEYLADIMNKHYNLSPSNDGQRLPPPTRDPERTNSSLADSIAAITTHNREYAKPFQFLNLGILAYTGDCTALAQVTTAPKTPAIKSTGKLGNTLWRSVYLGKQVSWRNRLLVLNDWMKRVWFGRDITRL